MGLYNNILKPINEVYFINNDMPRLERQIDLIRKGNFANQLRVNSSPEVERFNRLVEEIFGFETFCLVVDPVRSFNAWTTPISNTVDFSNHHKYLTQTKKGFSYNKNSHFSTCVWITQGVLFWKDNAREFTFTTREVVVLILHEIGHNFSFALAPKSQSLTYVKKMLNILTLPLIVLNPFMYANNIPGARKALNRAIEDMRRNNPDFVYAFNAFKNTIYSIGGFFQVVTQAINMVQMLINPLGVLAGFTAVIKDFAMSIARNPYRFIDVFVGHSFRDESISDNFASSYGYGADLSSALVKIRSKSGNIPAAQMMDNLGLLSAYYDFLLTPQRIVGELLDEHPMDVSRYHHQADYLRKELTRSGLDPKMRKQIEKDIKDIEKQIDIFADGKTPYNQNHPFSYLLHVYAFSIFKGDPRGWFRLFSDKELEQYKNEAYIFADEHGLLEESDYEHIDVDRIDLV